jgi:protein gp37
VSETTGISWTDATWNPWMGCTKVSPGCAHCYMFREQRQYGHDPEVVRRSKTKFTDPLKWVGDRIPGKGRGLVFTCSWSDFFHEDADAWREEAWAIIRATPHLTYQILTKRPERFETHLPFDWGSGYPNVWLGVSVETQRQVDRADLLGLTPARIRFLSCEPLLGRIRLGDALQDLHWVIAGGETGAPAVRRDMSIENFTALREEVTAAGVAFFAKQDSWGHPGQQGRIHDVDWVHEFPRQWMPPVAA